MFKSLNDEDRASYIKSLLKIDHEMALDIILLLRESQNTPQKHDYNREKDIIVAMLVASNESITDLYVSDLKEYDITSDECDMILRQLEKMHF